MTLDRKWLVELRELVIIALCTAPYALVVNRVLVPHAIIGGGLTGLCEILYFASGEMIPIWLSNLVINAILIVTAIFLLGWKSCVRALYGIFCLTVWLRLITVSEVPVISDPFMAVILCGILNGVALGLLYMNNGNTGGTDIVAMIVNKYRHVTMGRALFIVDVLIISSAWFLPQVTRVEQLLFGLCYVFVETQSVDWVMGRGRQSVQFFIFSREYEKIADAIMTRVGRGVTFLDAEGAYTNQETKLIMLVVRKSEAIQVFRIVHEIDPDAFISETPTRGVFGLGFENLKNET
ncbi:MAG: YitT family protein [Paludibacteraceae bacterium]|nr:YitT family protein [Paludibacteraceae bacterium]